MTVCPTLLFGPAARVADKRYAHEFATPDMEADLDHGNRSAMQSETVKKIIDTENLILAEQERLRRELDERLQRLKEEAEQAFQQRRQQLRQERRASLKLAMETAEAEAASILTEAKELAGCLDNLDNDTLNRCITLHLNLLLPGVADDRQDGQG